MWSDEVSQQIPRCVDVELSIPPTKLGLVNNWRECLECANQGKKAGRGLAGPGNVGKRCPTGMTTGIPYVRLVGVGS